MSEDLRSDYAYLEAIKTSHANEAARDRAYARLTNAGNFLTRTIASKIATHKDHVFYDSEEHVGLIEELRTLDGIHILPATAQRPATELHPELFDT